MSKKGFLRLVTVPLEGGPKGGGPVAREKEKGFPRGNA